MKNVLLLFLFLTSTSLFASTIEVKSLNKSSIVSWIGKESIKAGNFHVLTGKLTKKSEIFFNGEFVPFDPDTMKFHIKVDDIKTFKLKFIDDNKKEFEETFIIN